MKTVDINPNPLDTNKNKKNKSQISITKVANSFHNYHTKYGILKKKFTNQKQTNVSFQKSNNINSNVSFNNSINLQKNRNENNNKNTRIISIKQFYNIRKRIYKDLKKPFISPYLENIYIQKKYADNLIDIETFMTRVKIYDYFQISYLMNKKLKHYRLLSRFREYIIYNDDQEYLIKLFETDSCDIVMNYLLFHVYYKNKLALVAEKRKLNITNKHFIKSVNDLKHNRFNVESNSIIDQGYLKNLKPVLKSKIKYLYIYEIPKYLIPTSSPNLYPHFNKLSLKLKLYSNVRKYKFSNNFEFLMRDQSNISKKVENINDNNEKSIDLDDDKYKISNNISSEEKINDEIPNLLYKKYNKNQNKNDSMDKISKDIEIFIYKFNNSITKGIKNRELKQNILKYDKMIKLNQIKNQNKENKNKNNEGNINKFFESKKYLIPKNENQLSKIIKKNMFKTSLNKTDSISNSYRNISQKSTTHNFSSGIKELKHQINPSKTVFHLRRNNKNDKNNIINILQQLNFNKNNRNISFIKNITGSEKFVTKNIFETYREKFRYGNKKTKISNYLDNNNNNKNNSSFKNLNKSKSYNNLYSIHRNNKKNFFEKSSSKINKSQIYSLSGFEKIYKQTKDKGLIPITKITTNTIVHRPFGSSSSFFKYLENKESNKQIEPEINTIGKNYFLKKLKKNIIRNIQNQSKFFSKNNISWKEIAKSQNLYEQSNI